MYFISILLNKYLNKIFFVLFYLSFFFKFNSYLFFLIRLAIRLRFYENIDNLYLRIDKKKILNQKQIDTEIVLYSLNKINNKFQITYDNLSLNSKFFFNHLDCIKKLKTSKEIVNYIYKNKSNFDNKFKLFLFNLIHDYFSLDCFCDDLYNLIIFYQSLSFKEKKLFKAYKSNNLYKVSINDWWFKGFGHFFYLDTLIKAIQLNQVPFKKIYLDVNLKNVSNKFLYSKYKNILKKKNILCYSKKNTLELSLFCWLDKNKNFVSSDFFHFLINKLWSHKTKQPLINSDLNEKKQYRILCNKLNIPDPSRVLLIQIRNSPEDIKNFTIKDFRDFDPDNLIKNLNLFKDYSFILFGDSHSRIKIEKKNLFDYSKSKFVSEKNDFLLLTNAKGCVGSFSGPSHLASIYNVPTLYINCSQFWNHPVVKNSFFVPLTFHFKSKPLKFLDFFKISPPIIWSNDHALKNLDISRKFNNSKDLRYALKYFLSFLENKKIILKNIKLRYCWWNTKFEKNFLNTNYSNYFLAPTFKFFFNNKKKYFK